MIAYLQTKEANRKVGKFPAEIRHFQKGCQVKSMKKWTAVTVAVMLSLSLLGCAREPSSPPRELWYLGGAPILDGFQVVSTPGEDRQLDIVLFIPFDFVEEGFFCDAQGETRDGQVVHLLEGVTFTPGSYHGIPWEACQELDSLVLSLTYSWDGTVLSSRYLDLLTGEELAPTYVK